MTEQLRTVALIGPGRAGTTIALGLMDQGWTVVGVGGRAPDVPFDHVRGGLPGVASGAGVGGRGVVRRSC